MTAPSSIDPAHFLHEQLAQASPDLLRQMLTLDRICRDAVTPPARVAVGTGSTPSPG
jgi:hypothetical protein